MPPLLPIITAPTIVEQLHSHLLKGWVGGWPFAERLLSTPWPLALPGSSILMGFQSPCTIWTMWLEEHSATLPMLLLNWHQLSSLMGFSSSSAIKNLPDKAEDGGSIPESGKSPRGGNGNPSRKPHGQRSLAGFGSQGYKELDKTVHVHMNSFSLIIFFLCSWDYWKLQGLLHCIRPKIWGHSFIGNNRNTWHTTLWTLVLDARERNGGKGCGINPSPVRHFAYQDRKQWFSTQAAL